MPKAFTEEQRTHALAVLEAHNGKVREAARELGINPSTLIEWRNLGRAAAGDGNTKINAEIWESAQQMGAALVRDQLSRALDSDERIPARDLRDYAIAAGISADKHLDYRDGRKGTQINVDARSLTLPPGLTAEELRNLAFAPQPQIGEPDAST